MKFYKLKSWYRDKMKYKNEYIQFLPDLRDIKVVFITGLSMTLFFSWRWKSLIHLWLRDTKIYAGFLQQQE